MAVAFEFFLFVCLFLSGLSLGLGERKSPKLRQRIWPGSPESPGGKDWGLRWWRGGVLVGGGGVKGDSQGEAFRSRKS